MMKVAKVSYNHKEAFCLMWYQCKGCGGRVRIWNSRDGGYDYSGGVCSLRTARTR